MTNEYSARLREPDMLGDTGLEPCPDCGGTGELLLRDTSPYASEGDGFLHLPCACVLDTERQAEAALADAMRPVLPRLDIGSGFGGFASADEWAAFDGEVPA